MKKFLIVVLAISYPSIFSFSQNILDSLSKGKFIGSFESFSQYYYKDDKIGAFVPPDKIGSNNFLKLDYVYGKFSLGIQHESYAPSILGYYVQPQNGSKIVNKYFKYSDKDFSIQIGDFYEQFGSGLIFRSFENRQIGINNALEGANIFVAPTNFLKIKAFSGKTRRYFTQANSTTRGADIEIDLNNLFNKKNSNTSITLGGNFVSKYEEYTGVIDDFPTNSDAHSARIAINSNKLNFDAEFVEKRADPHQLNGYSNDIGQAFLMNLGYTANNFGFNINARALNNMDFRAERETDNPTQLTVNYMPALTKQQDYLTSNIYVYNTINLGETGFQADAFYNIKKGSKLGGKYGTKIAGNFAYYGGLNDKKSIFSVGKESFYRDFNFEIKKKWSKKFETTLGYQNMFYNTSKIQAASHDDVYTNLIAIGGLYKFGKQKALKYKLERMFVENDNGNWMAATAELSLNSSFSVYASDLYNDGKTNIHYYNFGASVSKNATRFNLSFGKQRAGLFCVGGVCRFVPAAYGFSASLTTSFGN